MYICIVDMYTYVKTGFYYSMRQSLYMYVRAHAYVNACVYLMGCTLWKEKAASLHRVRVFTKMHMLSCVGSYHGTTAVGIQVILVHVYRHTCTCTRTHLECSSCGECPVCPTLSCLSDSVVSVRLCPVCPTLSCLSDSVVSVRLCRVYPTLLCLSDSVVSVRLCCVCPTLLCLSDSVVSVRLCCVCPTPSNFVKRLPSPTCPHTCDMIQVENASSAWLRRSFASHVIPLEPMPSLQVEHSHVCFYVFMYVSCTCVYVLMCPCSVWNTCIHGHHRMSTRMCVCMYVCMRSGCAYVACISMYVRFVLVGSTPWATCLCTCNTLSSLARGMSSLHIYGVWHTSCHVIRKNFSNVQDLHAEWFRMHEGNACAHT
jgi:hypothetical protein